MLYPTQQAEEAAAGQEQAGGPEHAGMYDEPHAGAFLFFLCLLESKSVLMSAQPSSQTLSAVSMLEMPT